MWHKQNGNYAFQENRLLFSAQQNKIIIEKSVLHNEQAFFLGGAFLELCYDFGFPEIENFPANSLQLPPSFNTLRFFFPVALQFLEIAENKNITSPLLERTFSYNFSEGLPILPVTNLREITQALTTYLKELKQENFHRFSNFCYTFNLPEEYFLRFMKSEKDLVRLFIAKQMQKICFRKKFG